MADIENIDDTEAMKVIQRLTCSIYHREGITYSEAQGIFGDLVDADEMFSYMLENKWIMVHPDPKTRIDKYEFTFKGLKEFIAQWLGRFVEEFNRTPTGNELINYTRKEAAKLSI